MVRAVRSLLILLAVGAALLVAAPHPLLEAWLRAARTWGGTAWPLLLAAPVVALALFLLWRFLLPVTLGIRVDNSVLYPNRSQAQRMLVVRIRLARRAAVALEIRDEFNRPVMVLMEPRTLSPGETFRLWDGRAPHGAPLGDGSYQIIATARSKLRTAHASLWVRLDKSKTLER